MTAQTENIQKALGLLDVTNNEHWTADGLPRLDAVRAIAGDSAISREDVNKASPGFIRPSSEPVTPSPWGSNPVAAPWGSSAGDAQSTSQNDGSSDDAGDAGDADESDDEDLPTVEGSDSAPEVEIPEFEGDAIAVEIKGRLHAATLVLEGLTQEKVKLLQELELMQREVDEISDELVAYVGVETTADALRGYFARQKQILAERAARLKLLSSSGVDLRALTAGLKAPLDAAMSRKTGRGGSRPKR